MKERQTKAKSPISKSEDGIQYLTKDKEYIITHWNSEKMFYITDDTGEVLNCLVAGCSHLNGKNWKLS